jgi:hypothetical protein
VFPFSSRRFPKKMTDFRSFTTMFRTERQNN